MSSLPSLDDKRITRIFVEHCRGFSEKRRGLAADPRSRLSTEQFLSRRTAENELEAGSNSAQDKLGGGGGTNANVR